MLAVALVVIAAAVVLVARGVEVRVVLLAAALLLGGLAGDVPAVVREFLGTFAAERFVVPICSAMGFAYVLKHTGCDVAMVRVLLAPVRRSKGLLVPAVVLAGFVVNIPVISQASTAVCLGAVVVPLMRAAGFSAVAIGSTLLLGASVGGELLNPGAPELNSVRDKVGGDTRDLVPHVARLLVVVLPVALAVHWILTIRAERRAPAVPADAIPDAEPLTGGDFLRALVPVVPLALLFLSGPPFRLIEIPDRWMVPAAADPRASSRMVGLAMLVGVAVAAAAVPRQARGCMTAFFAGAGYGFANIVSLIVTASCFAKGIELVGLAAALGDGLRAYPGLLTPLSAVIPAGFAALSGSGMASTQGLFGSFYTPAVEAGVDPRGVGALVAVASAAGRTMSPVAAVVLMCGTLSGAPPLALARRVAPPLVAGLAAAVGLRVLGGG